MSLFNLKKHLTSRHAQAAQRNWTLARQQWLQQERELRQGSDAHNTAPRVH